jgi:hypothetical protein
MFCGLVLLFAAIPVSMAQISAGGTPPSFGMALTAAVPTVQTQAVDVQALLTEDEQAPKDEPFRFGANIDVAYNLTNSGQWTDLPGGARLWRLRISSSGAYSVNLLYDHFHMPSGGQLFLYNDDHSQVIGAFTDFNNFETGKFATQPLAGDALTLEYYEPTNVYGQGVISISQVIHAYRNLFGRPGAVDAFGSSGSCNNNVNCPIGYNWQSDKRGVAMILSGGSRICTGSLINNVNQNQTPYFLTANHCLGGESTWMFMFNYEAPACANVDGPTSQTVSNATLRAHNSASDFALLQLSSNVPLSYAPYFNGWNNVNVAADSTTVIHHPSGDIKKISFDRDQPVSSTWSGTPANSHWRILAYESGTTEPGSSGSPLFDQNHRIIGQLHGGTASCSNNIDDYYGKVSMSWTYGGSSSNELRDWLDPSNTGATVLDGYSPVSLTITAPNGAESWAIGTIHAITWTSANLSQNVKIELNRTYPTGTWETIVASTSNSGSYNWTVAGSATTTARIRISGVTAISLNDISNANFTISSVPVPSITVSVPNGGETWYVGEANNITWTSANISENVKIELNRSYPGATWETIVASTANSGSYSWTVNSPVTSTARVRITGTVQTTVGDTSNANFSIAARTVTVTAPNGGENWVVGSGQNITWSTQNISGNVNIDLNRNYPAGAWESIAANVLDNGFYSWTVTTPVTTSARVRVTSVSYPTVNDVSDANFTIYTVNLPPVIAHDPLHDQPLTPFTVTATVTDDAPGFNVTLYYRAVGAGSFTSSPITATGHPNEYAVTVGALAAGQYEYYISVTDAGNLTIATAHYFFYAAADCGSEIAYDDGTAERSNWSQNTHMKWAVKFDAPLRPFLLCNVRVGISAVNPDASHSPIQVSIQLADGVGGTPGTVVATRLAGSIGNVIGGVPLSPDNWTTVIFRDNGQQFILNGTFYVVVSNPDSAAGYEAFLSDSSSALAGRSYVYDACDSTWYPETVTNDTLVFRGNRMIRVSGFGLVPPNDVVISSVGNDIRLDWSNVGAPYYHVYSALTVDGPYETLVGSTGGTTLTDVGVADLRKFYRVYASTTP